jgi:DNA phosphorothioation-associated putative methyltransferase
MASRQGKHVFSRVYSHTSLIPSQQSNFQQLVRSASGIAGITQDIDYNVVRVEANSQVVALLDYPNFFETPFPALRKSWKVRVLEATVSVRDYEQSLNPPILHRKELMLNRDHPHYACFASLTRELEALDMFSDPVRIGFKRNWEKLLLDRGFSISGHQLVPIGNDESPSASVAELPTDTEIARHLTALHRNRLSAPVTVLERFGYLDGSRTVFDYGCGKGDDLRGLLSNGIHAAGWDPYYSPDSKIVPAAVVNLGFVINVIEDPIERLDALQRAFSLAGELLVVSTMIARDNPIDAMPYGDGILTTRSTFQKYYTQQELRAYLQASLGEGPISVAPGIFFVFKDKTDEQRFLHSRQRSPVRSVPRNQPQRPPKEHPPEQPNLYQVHRTLLHPLWQLCLDLGRAPEPEEVQNLAQIEQALSSLKRALRLTLANNNPEDLQRAREQRADDLMVYLALEEFQSRKRYGQLEPRLQRDVRAFFGSYESARMHARNLLFQVAQPEVLDKCCQMASEKGLGWYEPSHFLQLHSSLVSRLPAALRVYFGCSGVIYGDASQADIIKIHIRSGKVSFMRYDDFVGNAIPRMTERIKVNLRTLDLQLFAYGNDYPCPPLYFKSRYINEEFPNYAAQIGFDDALQGTGIDLTGYGPTEQDFSASLGDQRLQVSGFRLERLHRVPNLDSHCGRYLTYRRLIECGETFTSTGISNVPTNPESYTALHDLLTNIIDPVIEYFGGIELTYGFCSPQLSSQIKRRIAPKLDQHAAHEKTRTDQYVCPRLGAAIDFVVRDENMREVADWIIQNLPYDRLYFYGEGRPLHVSYGPGNSREAFEMTHTASGKLIPRPYNITKK